MASVVVVRSDELSTLLDDDEWSPPVDFPTARLSPSQPATPRLDGKATTRRPKHAVTRFMCSPFAAVFRTCARASAVSTRDQQQPISSNGAAEAERRRRREATRRRPSLEQLLRMEAPPAAPLSSSARPAERGKGRPSCALVKEEEEEEEPFSYIIVAPDEEGHAHAAAAVPAAAELELEPAGRGQTNAKSLVVVVFASLRACSRPPRISSGKVAASRAPGKTELFYYRPIPMGRRCRVQHLEESPYK